MMPTELRESALRDLLLEVTGLIYESVTDPSRWAVFLEKISGAIRAQRACLLMAAPLVRNTSVCWYGWADEDVKLYAERYGAMDPWGIAAATRPEASVEADYEFCPRERMESSLAFQEFYAPRDCIHGMGGVILSSDKGHSFVTAVRGRSYGPFGEPEKRILRALMPDLKRAMLLHGEVASLREKVAAFTDHLNRYVHAVFLIDAEARVIHRNAAASEIVASPDGIGQVADRLTFTSQRDSAKLEQVISELCTNRGAPLRRLLAPRPSGKESYRVILMPVQHAGAIRLGVSSPAVSVLVIDRDTNSDPDEHMLGEIFNLTPSEARVAGKLALGQSVKEVAAALGISIETARTHTKRILSKTATSRQGELISLILRSVPIRQP